MTKQVKLRARIMVAVPCYTGKCDIEQLQAIQLATLHCFMQGVIFEVVTLTQGSLVQMVRNWFVAEFLARKEFTHLLWLDDDLAFSADGIMKLVNSDKDCIGGVYLTKHPKHPIFPYKATGPVKDFLQPASRVPTGFLLVKRHVVEDVASQCDTYMYEHDDKVRETPHVFDIAMIPDDEHPGKLRPLGEDFLFTQRVLEAGYEVFVRTDIAFSHFGRNEWSGKLSTTLAEEEAKGQPQGTYKE